jgi:nucleoid-associated protein YgaU
MKKSIRKKMSPFSFVQSLVLLLFLQGCLSSSEVTSDENAKNSLELSDGILLSDDLAVEDQVEMDGESDTQKIAQDVLDQSSSQAIIHPDTQIELTQDILEYLPKKGQTLMWIAFEIYGDYRMWKDLYELNKDVLNENQDISHRPLLKYRKPASAYTQPQGSPYLVKGGDSLSKISKKVYGNWRKWPSIYENNKKQIRFPNLIFAGFTLYYLPADEIANELY